MIFPNEAQKNSKGLVKGLSAIIEDPSEDTNLENLTEKLCNRYAGKYKTKVRRMEACYKFDLCSFNASPEFTGTARFF